MAHKYLKSYLTGISHSVGKEMAGSSHTLTCCLSELRNSLGADKKRPRVLLEYTCSVTEVLFYSSFGVLMVACTSRIGKCEEYSSQFHKWKE